MLRRARVFSSAGSELLCSQKATAHFVLAPTRGLRNQADLHVLTKSWYRGCVLTLLHGAVCGKGGCAMLLLLLQCLVLLLHAAERIPGD